MVEVLDYKVVLDYMSRYFDRLTAHGYVGEGTAKSYLRYLFIADFVDMFYVYITDADYAQISRLLHTMFSNGNCLLSYPMFCDRRTKVMSGFRERMIPRITEDAAALRITENEKLREV